MSSLETPILQLVFGIWDNDVMAMIHFAENIKEIFQNWCF
jgi:hypothetical protein